MKTKVARNQRLTLLRSGSSSRIVDFCRTHSLVLFWQCWSAHLCFCHIRCCSTRRGIERFHQFGCRIRERTLARRDRSCRSGMYGAWSCPLSLKSLFLSWRELAQSA